eukprot:g70607.t1
MDWGSISTPLPSSLRTCGPELHSITWGREVTQAADTCTFDSWLCSDMPRSVEMTQGVERRKSFKLGLKKKIMGKKVSNSAWGVFKVQHLRIKRHLCGLCFYSNMQAIFVLQVYLSRRVYIVFDQNISVSQ